MNKPLIISLIVVVLILIAITILVLFQNQNIQKRLASSPSPQATSSVQTNQDLNNPSPSNPLQELTSEQYIKNQITKSLNSKNYQELAIYMTNPSVNFTLMSTECCGQITKDEAVSQMAYISGAEPFNFDQSSQLVKDLKSNNERLTDAFVGISQNGEQLVAFKFDAQNQITSIELAISHTLYN